MNTQKLFQNQFENNFKTFLLMAISFAVIGLLGYFISIRTGNFAIMYGFLLLGIIQNIIGYWFSGSIAIKFSGAIKTDDIRLKTMIENLSKKAGILTPEIYIIEDNNMNAFATGRNQANAKVAVTRGLMNKLNDEELEGVIAHELAHIGNKDILISSVVAIMAGIITHMIYIFSTTRSDNKNSSGIVGILTMLLAPFAGLLIQMAVSRSREFQADATAAHIVGNPNGLISALQKIHENNVEPMIHADEATAHMYIANPFGNIKNIGGLFMTHPAVEDRVEKLKSLVL